MKKFLSILLVSAMVFISCGNSGGRTVSGNSLTDKLVWMENNAKSGESYIFELRTNESIDGLNLSFSDRTDITVTVRGVGANRTVSLSENIIMFYVPEGNTLILDKNITLKGRDDNIYPLVYVDTDGTLVMNDGANITGNTANNAGGVYVVGTFTMNGGTISGNKAGVFGGGVFVASDGTFTMNGGTISDNSAIRGGGGLLVSGTFNLKGGTISGNISDIGGGVVLTGNAFTMSGGTITSNSAASIGGGMYLEKGLFNKTGGTITGYENDQRNGNVVKDDTGAIIGNMGHAIYTTFHDTGLVLRKEGSAGPQMKLTYNGNNGSFTGEWDDSRSAQSQGGTSSGGQASSPSAQSGAAATSSRTSGTAISSQSSTRLSGTYSMIFGSAGLLYYTFDTNGTYVYGTGYAGAVSAGTYTVEENKVTLSSGETFTIVNSTTIRGEGSGRLYTK
jgi:hypothetical protein